MAQPQPHAADKGLVNTGNDLLIQHCSGGDYGRNRRQRIATAGVFKNSGHLDMTLHMNYEWSGVPKVPYPQRIAKSRLGTFVHTAKSFDEPDEAALIYQSGEEDYARAWLVAWSINNPQIGENKVYVKAGQLSEYIGMDSNTLKNKLTDSGGDSMAYIDPVTGCKVFAGFTPLDNGYALTATFSN